MAVLLISSRGRGGPRPRHRVLVMRDGASSPSSTARPRRRIDPARRVRDRGGRVSPPRQPPRSGSPAFGGPPERPARLRDRVQLRRALRRARFASAVFLTAQTSQRGRPVGDDRHHRRGGTLVLIAGGLDLSTGAIFALTGIVATKIAKASTCPRCCSAACRGPAWASSTASWPRPHQPDHRHARDGHHLPRRRAGGLRRVSRACRTTAFHVSAAASSSASKLLRLAVRRHRGRGAVPAVGRPRSGATSTRPAATRRRPACRASASTSSARRTPSRALRRARRHARQLAGRRPGRPTAGVGIEFDAIAAIVIGGTRSSAARARSGARCSACCC